MKKTLIVVLLIALSAVSNIALGSVATEDTMTVKKQLAKFAPVNVELPSKLLTARQKKLVDELVAAAKIMDQIFLRQVYEENAVLEDELKKNSNKAPYVYEYFTINFGPFDRLNHNEPFVKGVGAKPAGATFYPTDMTKKEFTNWLKKHPSDREAFESNFTVIRRDGKSLKAIPYSQQYAELLTKAADHLNKAAKLATNKTLKKYLKSRAKAFLSNDYYESDVDWVRLKDHAIEVVIGPYEVYEDNLFGYKAAFEAFVTRVDPAESKRLAKVVAYLDDLEKNLPIDDKYKGIGRSLSSPIVVAQLIYSAGDTKAGVQTLAFNLPNDERIREQEGSKKVMLKNVQKAKFEKILVPIAQKLMNKDDAADVDFEAFFAHTLLHEVSHGIGPGKINKGGEETTVNKELKELYSVIEECKADTLSAYNAVYLTDKGLYPKNFLVNAWPTYLAGLFRSVRFGISEAHGGSNAIQFNYLLEKGAITYDENTWLFGVNRAKIQQAITDLASDLLLIEAQGDYDAAKSFVKKYRTTPASLKAGLEKLSDVPVDIKPIYAYK
ncbi:MAG: peptidase [Pseudomonadota bacterium]